jgi:hypothetical protein
MDPSGSTWLLAYHRRACNAVVASSAQSQLPPAHHPQNHHPLAVRSAI